MTGTHFSSSSFFGPLFGVGSDCQALHHHLGLTTAAFPAAKSCSRLHITHLRGPRPRGPSPRPRPRSPSLPRPKPLLKPPRSAMSAEVGARKSQSNYLRPAAALPPAPAEQHLDQIKKQKNRAGSWAFRGTARLLARGRHSRKRTEAASARALEGQNENPPRASGQTQSPGELEPLEETSNWRPKRARLAAFSPAVDFRALIARGALRTARSADPVSGRKRDTLSGS